MARTVNVVAINLLAQAGAVRKTSLKHGRQVIPPDTSLQAEVFRPLAQPETLEIAEELVVVGIAVVAGSGAS